MAMTVHHRGNCGRVLDVLDDDEPEGELLTPDEVDAKVAELLSTLKQFQEVYAVAYEEGLYSECLLMEATLRETKHSLGRHVRRLEGLLHNRLQFPCHPKRCGAVVEVKWATFHAMEVAAREAGETRIWLS
jgi:hypothetical protein